MTYVLFQTCFFSGMAGKRAGRWLQQRATMLHKADVLIQDIMKDTVQVDTSLLRTWLANKESLEASYAIVGSYLSDGEHEAASQKMDKIPQVFNLDADGMFEHGKFSDLISLWQNVQSMEELGEQEVLELQDIVLKSSRRAGAMAQGILNTWHGGSYRVIPLLPDVGESPELMAPPPNNNTSVSVQYLTAYPNPARNSVTFRWDLPEDMESATILLSDLQGKTIKVLEISGQKGKQEWNTEKVEHGVYLYRLQLPDGNMETPKLTIIK